MKLSEVVAVSCQFIICPFCPIHISFDKTQTCSSIHVFVYLVVPNFVPLLYLCGVHISSCNSVVSILIQ